MNALVASHVQKLLILYVGMLVVIPDNSSTVNSMHTKLLTHPLATYVLTRQDTAILSEGDGDKIVRIERKSFSSSRFNSLSFNVIGS